MLTPKPHPVPSAVFVYGTLKPGGRNYAVAARAEISGVHDAFIEGYGLYALEPEGYPALVSGEGRVYGKVLVYRDIRAALEHLDALEGCALTPPLYRRVEALARPVGMPVWTYLYARQARLQRPGATLLKEGSWPEGKD